MEGTCCSTGGIKRKSCWEQWAGGDTFLIEKGAIGGKLSAGDKSGPGRYAAGRGNGRETICKKMAKCPGHKNRWWQKVYIWKTGDIQGKNFATRNLLLKKFPKLRRIILPYWDGRCYNLTYMLGEANTFSDKIHYRRIMRDDSCKRIGAWLLTLVLLVSALPYTAFAASEDSRVVNATMEETLVEDIASNVTTQLLRGAKTKNETLSMEAKPTHEDSDPVEIIVVVDDSVAKPAAQAQVQSLLQKQEKAAATMSRAIGETVEPQRQYTTLLNGFSATVTYGQYKALKELDCVESVFLSPTFSLLPDTANSTQMIGGGLANETGFTGEGMLIAILDTGVDMDHQIFSKAPANPALTQDDVKGLLSQYDFQAEGIVKGLSVSSVYKSAKFPFQFDYGDKDTDGAPGTKSSHGTHVASTAAGCTGINEDVQGVAPDAQIANMNVFKSSGGASYADILSALEDCILLGVDVANLSLGSDAGYIDYENPDEFTESLLNALSGPARAVCLWLWLPVTLTALLTAMPSATRRWPATPTTA